jgi:hypothetical protein
LRFSSVLEFFSVAIRLSIVVMGPRCAVHPVPGYRAVESGVNRLE